MVIVFVSDPAVFCNDPIYRCNAFNEAFPGILPISPQAIFRATKFTDRARNWAGKC